MKNSLNITLSFFLCLAFFSNVSFAQGSFRMCTDSYTSDSVGTIYDSGGPTGNYQVFEDCTLLVAPPCAMSITLTFSSFNVQNNYDRLVIYDSPTSVGAVPVLTASGGNLPSSITCTSGYMLLAFHSGNIPGNYSGFECSWTSVIPQGVAPNAAFSMNDNTPPLGVDVIFTDQSTGDPTDWLWDFGDGNTSQLQNPTHSYSAAGNYTVTLIAQQCEASDTLSQSLVVQNAPDISINPTSFSAYLQCGDSVDFPLTISNLSGGELFYTIAGSVDGPIELLSMTYGSDHFSEYLNTLTALSNHSSAYHLTSTNTIDPAILGGQLIGKNVLLIPEQESGLVSVWQNLASAIQQFVNGGGAVIICGANSSQADCIFSTGLFSGSFGQDAEGDNVFVADPNDSLYKGINANSFEAPSATYTMHLTNQDKIKVIDHNGEDVVTYRNIGNGKAIFLAFDYYDTIPESGQILANAVEWAGRKNLPSWVTVSPDEDTVTSGNNSVSLVRFYSGGFPSGTYYVNLTLSNNDPNSPTILLPCTLTISDDPRIELSDSCISFGPIVQNTTARDTFRIYNSGCDTLFISSMTITGSNSFSISSNFPYILPGSYGNAIVSVYDPIIHPINGTLNIFNNDIDTSICLSANILSAPIIQTSINSITSSIRACNDSGTVTFTLRNTATAGSAPLIFTVVPSTAWITCNPSNGTIPAGDSISIEINYTSGLLPGGSTNANIAINSNDPNTPIRNLPFTMNVDFNPCVSFSQVPDSCSGRSTFSISEINTPTSYYWIFGDGDTSSFMNPVHSYPQTGTFYTQLIACNSYGCDTVADSIHVIVQGPTPTDCYPTTIGYCCGIGINDFQILDQNITILQNSSGDAFEGYQDYTCEKIANLVTNYSYNVSITTGFVYFEKVRIWLDMDNNGVLDSIAERLYDTDSLVNHTGTILIPNNPTNVYNMPLRLRIGSDYDGNLFPNPCQDLLQGQVEDYTVYLTLNTSNNSVDQNLNFNIHPNPTAGSFNLKYKLNQKTNPLFIVMDPQGKVVYNCQLNSNSATKDINLEFLPAGVYHCKVQTDNNLQWQSKLIIVN